MLRVERLLKRFNGRCVVDHLSFAVQPSEIFGLLGPNGAGKTTTIRMMLGIFEPDEGTIRFGNGKAPPESIGYLPEERGLYEKTKLLETIIYFARLRSRRQRAELEREALQWLERLDLAEYAHKRIETLSKGMRQKAQFIAAILHRPQFAILDEPFSGLDPVNQELFLDLLRELRQQGMTILLSSHQMNLVEALCDRILLIHQGKGTLSGTMEEIQRTYGEEIVRLKGVDSATSFVQHPEVRAVRTEGEYIELYLKRDTRVNEYLKSLLEHMNIEELSVRRSTLHEIYVQAVTAEKGLK